MSKHFGSNTSKQSLPDGVKEKSLVQLNPTKDDNGLLRVNGRLRLADEIPYDTKYPIVLPKDHYLTRLIILDVHEALGHASGIEHTLTQLRVRFWIVKGRRCVRAVITSCPE